MILFLPLIFETPPLLFCYGNEKFVRMRNGKRLRAPPSLIAMQRGVGSEYTQKPIEDSLIILLLLLLDEQDFWIFLAAMVIFTVTLETTYIAIFIARYRHTRPTQQQTNDRKRAPKGINLLEK